VKAGVGELRLRFDAADGQHSIAAAACLPDDSVEEGGLPDACFAYYQQRSPVLSRSCEGGLEFCDLSVPSSQPDHPVRVRVPGVYVIRAASSSRASTSARDPTPAASGQEMYGDVRVILMAGQGPLALLADRVLGAYVRPARGAGAPTAGTAAGRPR